MARSYKIGQYGHLGGGYILQEGGIWVVDMLFLNRAKMPSMC